jgi:hypothetical protein
MVIGVLLLERTLGLENEETYLKLKSVLAEGGCRIISEQPPNKVLVKHGSLWGVTPKTAKKHVEIKLEPADSGTKISVTTTLSSDWKNITIIGCVFAVVLVGVCVWIAFDLNAFMALQQPNFWSWIVTAGGSVDFAAGHAFVNLSWVLAVFLSAVVAAEILIAVYVQKNIDKFAEETINSLSK